MLRRLTGLAAAMLVATQLQAASGPKGPSPAPVRAGESLSSAAKSVQAVDLSGKPVNPFELATGKAAVLVYVRTDCPISNRYAPTIQALSHKYSGSAVLMLIYPDKDETSANIQKHLQEYGYKLTALRDPQHALVKLGEVEITPEAAVFNAKGEIIYHGRIDNWYKDFGRARSAPTTHELDDAIQAALNSHHPAPASVGGIGCYISDLQ